MLPACNYTGEFYTKFQLRSNTLAQAQSAYAALKSKPSFAIRLHDRVGPAGNHTSYQVLLKQLIPPPTTVGLTNSKFTAWRRTTFQFHAHGNRSGLQARVYMQAFPYDMFVDGLTMSCAGPAAPAPSAPPAPLPPTTSTVIAAS